MMKELQELWEVYDFWERQAGYIKNNKIEQIKLTIKNAICEFIKDTNVRSQYWSETELKGHFCD